MADSLKPYLDLPGAILKVGHALLPVRKSSNMAGAAPGAGSGPHRTLRVMLRAASVPARCPIRWSVEGYHGHSRQGREHRDLA